MVMIKTYRPTSPGVRGKITVKHEHLSKDGPHKSLLEKKIRGSGRNNQGRITTRHQGGGHDKKYRIIDFKRADKDGIMATVKAIEYDPNRSAHIALICYVDGTYRYIVAPEGMRAGDQVCSGVSSEIKVGNCLPLMHIPVGTTIHCIEMRPMKGAQIARSAGASCMLAGREGDYAIIKLKSGEIRRIHQLCRATIGVVSNGEHALKVFGKAGAKRWKGVRPTVRGVAMNPVDHPMGGGEGKTSGGRHPCSPWGRKERVTRLNKRTQPMILRARKKRYN